MFKWVYSCINSKPVNSSPIWMVFWTTYETIRIRMALCVFNIRFHKLFSISFFCSNFVLILNYSFGFLLVVSLGIMSLLNSSFNINPNTVEKMFCKYFIFHFPNKMLVFFGERIFWSGT